MKALFFLKIFNFCPGFFGHIEKGPDKKAKAIFKIYGIINEEANGYNTRTGQYLKK